MASTPTAVHEAALSAMHHKLNASNTVHSPLETHVAAAIVQVAVCVKTMKTCIVVHVFVRIWIF